MLPKGEAIQYKMPDKCYALEVGTASLPFATLKSRSMLGA